MTTTDRGWQVLSDDLLVHEYTIGSGNGINTVAFRLADGGMAVISPPSRPPDDLLAALAERGEVRAMVAPNAFHNLGLPRWQKLFPDAGVYAGAGAIKRLAKRQPFLNHQPASALAEAMPDGTALVELPGMRNGETWLRTTVNGRPAWYCGDVLLNMREMIGAAGKFLGFMGMGPGLKANPINRTFMVKDRKAMRQEVSGLLDSHAPAIMVPGHGEVLHDDTLPDRIRGLLIG